MLKSEFVSHSVFFSDICQYLSIFGTVALFLAFLRVASRGTRRSQLQFREMPLGVNVGLDWHQFLAAVNLVRSPWSLSVLSCKITNVRRAGHFLQERLQGAQEFAYEAEGARGF